MWHIKMSCLLQQALKFFISHQKEIPFKSISMCRCLCFFSASANRFCLILNQNNIFVLALGFLFSFLSFFLLSLYTDICRYMRLSLCGCVYIFLKLTFRFKFHMNAPLPGCLCHPEQALSLRRCANPCNSFRPALPSSSSVPETLALGASYSVPVYLLPSVRPFAPLAVPCLRQVIVSAIRVVFVLFVFVYFLPLLLQLCLARRFLFYAWHHGFLCYFFLVSFFSTSPVAACFRFISLFPADFMAPAVRPGGGRWRGRGLCQAIKLLQVCLEYAWHSVHFFGQKGYVLRACASKRTHMCLCLGVCVCRCAPCLCVYTSTCRFFILSCENKKSTLRAPLCVYFVPVPAVVVVVVVLLLLCVFFVPLAYLMLLFLQPHHHHHHPLSTSTWAYSCGSNDEFNIHAQIPIWLRYIIRALTNLDLS